MTDVNPEKFVLKRKEKVMNTYLGRTNHSNGAFISQLEEWIAQ